MSNQTYLMGMITGVVKTVKEWKDDWAEAKKNDQLEEFGWKEKWEDNLGKNGLIEVIRNPDSGNWQPA